ncbi:MAG: hypothetical protein LBK82_10180 [Planctomycetaceae bacterium]|nr:hypothetical protein [Planctomycetaceae bacterium]
MNQINNGNSLLPTVLESDCQPETDAKQIAKGCLPTKCCPPYDCLPLTEIPTNNYDFLSVFRIKVPKCSGQYGVFFIGFRRNHVKHNTRTQ